MERAIALIVNEASACPLLKPGDRWVICGREMRYSAGSQFCAFGLSHVLSEIRDQLATLPQGAPFPYRSVDCLDPGCKTYFKIEFLSPGEAQALFGSPPTASGSALQPVSGAAIPAGEPTPKQETHSISSAFPTPEPTAATETSVIPKENQTMNVPSTGVRHDSDTRFTRRMERGANAASEIRRRSGPFMAQLNPEIVTGIMNTAETENFSEGQIILDEGVTGNKFYIVSQGEVEVVRTNIEDRSETVLAVLQTGECFGEMSLLTGQPTSATVRGKGNCSVLSLIPEKLDGLLDQHPQLHKHFSKLLADRVKAANVTMESEMGRGIMGRLSMISLIDLIQTMHSGQRTGTLVLSGPGQEAHIGFQNGRVISAKDGDLLSEEAFYKIITWPDGDFCFEPDEPKTEGPVQMDTMGLLMEGMRRMDESSKQNPPAG